MTHTRPPWRSARVFVAAQPEASAQDPDPDRVAAATITLNDWLDLRCPWPHPDPTDPWIAFMSVGETIDVGGETCRIDERLRGLFDPDAGRIWLVRPWNPDNPEDLGVLLHELVHARQTAQRWECPQAMELPAYKLHELRLQENGITPDFNCLSIYLQSSCRPRDHHPN